MFWRNVAITFDHYSRRMGAEGFKSQPTRRHRNCLSRYSRASLQREKRALSFWAAACAHHPIPRFGSKPPPVPPLPESILTRHVDGGHRRRSAVWPTSPAAGPATLPRGGL